MYVHSFKGGEHVWLTDDVNDSDIHEIKEKYEADPQFAVHNVVIKGKDYVLAVKAPDIDVTDKDQCIQFAGKLTALINKELGASRPAESYF